MGLVLGADLSLKRSAFVLIDSTMVVQDFETFPILGGPKLNLRATRLFVRKLKAYTADLCVIENNDHQVWYRPLFHGLLTACQARDLATASATPSAVRKVIVGKGNATKAEVAFVLGERFGIGFEDDEGYDLSDAAACAVWGVMHLRGVK